MFITCRSGIKNELTANAINPPGIVDSIYNFTEEAPRFPGCDELKNRAEKSKCTDEKLLKFIYSKIQYPQYAVDHQIEGRCVVSFVVEKDGSVSNIKIVKDIGGGCGEASVKLIASMNEMSSKWIPAKQNNKAVRALFNLPISFRLIKNQE